MLTRRSTSRTADNQPPHGWIAIRFWVGTFGVFVTTFSLALVAVTFSVSLVLGYRPITVISGSMEPRISVGDVVLYEPHPLAGIGEGTVIVFDDPTIDGGTAIHRVVATDPDTGWLQTKGDANTTPDSTSVTEDSIKGVARTLIPYVGLPAAWIQTGRRVPAFALAAFIAVSAWVARWGWNTRNDPWAKIVTGDAESQDAAAPMVATISGIELLAAALLRIVAPLPPRRRAPGHQQFQMLKIL